MFFGLSHVDVPVRSLQRAAALYVDAMGFERGRQGPGWLEVNASTCALRLMEVARPQSAVNLRIQVSDVAEAFLRLKAAGLVPMYEPMRSPDLEHLACLQDPDGHAITVWRPLTEDEYGFVPELPTTVRWPTESEALLKALLAKVPALFRALARRKVTRWAEDLSEGAQVTPHTVVRAYILSSARVTRFRTREPLIQAGYAPEDFQADYDAD